MAYLDHAATTRVRPEVVEAMQPFLADRFGNPSGAHAVARDARRAVDEARDVVAEALGCQPGEVVFTSGGTESDNTAVFGAHRKHAGTVLCSAIEHHAVLDPVLAVGGRTIGVDRRGVLDLDALRAALDPSVTLVSVMLVNNEVGTIQPLGEVVEHTKAVAPGALVHTDAVQAFAWLDVAALAAGADLVSISGHKVGGPKGVGALVVRRPATIEPLLLGGGQERGMRSGTHDVAGIVGLAAAAELVVAERKAQVDRIEALRDRLLDGLRVAVPGLVETACPPGTPDRSHLAPAIAHVCIEGIESEALLFLLEEGDVFASAASSCSSGAMVSSHVLAAMGADPAWARGSLRLSLGYDSTGDDVEWVLTVLPPAVERLRLLD